MDTITQQHFLGGELKQPDPQGRITLGKKYAGETYSVREEPNGDIILQPVVVMHRQEKWLFENQEALAMVKRGLAEMAERKFVEGPELPPCDEDADDED